jgi:predicted nucleic acid-binding protein
MKEELQGDFTLDTGVLVELLRGSDQGALVKQQLEGEILRGVTGEMNLFELRCLTCRKLGWDRSARVITDIVESGYFRTLPASEFLERAASLKCERSISSVDCLTIAMAESLEIPVLFAKHEAELDKEIAKKGFKSEIYFLNDLSLAPRDKTSTGR